MSYLKWYKHSVETIECEKFVSNIALYLHTFWTLHFYVQHLSDSLYFKILDIEDITLVTISHEIYQTRLHSVYHMTF